MSNRKPRSPHGPGRYSASWCVCAAVSLLCVASLTTGCGSSVKPRTVYVQVPAEPPPASLLTPCPALTEPEAGPMDVDDLVAVALSWAEAHHVCADRHRRLSEAVR